MKRTLLVEKLIDDVLDNAITDERPPLWTRMTELPDPPRIYLKAAVREKLEKKYARLLK